MLSLTFETFIVTDYRRRNGTRGLYLMKNSLNSNSNTSGVYSGMYTFVSGPDDDFQLTIKIVECF
jgi:hypothetical protein